MRPIDIAITMPNHAGEHVGAEAGFPKSIPLTFMTWLDRYRQRRALSRLDDRLLNDIGVNRFDAAQEAEKPFWQG